MATTVTIDGKWGDQATVLLGNGSSDTRGYILVTPGGTGIKASPTITLTFGTAFTAVPIVLLSHVRNAPLHWEYWFSFGRTNFIITFIPRPLAIDIDYAWTYYCIAP